MTLNLAPLKIMSSKNDWFSGRLSCPKNMMNFPCHNVFRTVAPQEPHDYFHSIVQWI